MNILHLLIFILNYYTLISIIINDSLSFKKEYDFIYKNFYIKYFY